MKPKARMGKHRHDVKQTNKKNKTNNNNHETPKNTNYKKNGLKQQYLRMYIKSQALSERYNSLTYHPWLNIHTWLLFGGLNSSIIIQDSAKWWGKKTFGKKKKHYIMPSCLCTIKSRYSQQFGVMRIYREVKPVVLQLHLNICSKIDSHK